MLHRATAKVYVLRLQTHEWTEADFEDMIVSYVQLSPGIASAIGWAVRHSYQTITGQEMG